MSRIIFFNPKIICYSRFPSPFYILPPSVSVYLNLRKANRSLWPCERRLWPVVYFAHCVFRIRREEFPEATPACKRGAEDRDRSNSRLECQVPHTRGMGEGQEYERSPRWTTIGWDGRREG